MRKNIATSIGLGLTLCLAIIATDVAAAQQGKDNARKNAIEAREDKNINTGNQKGRQQEAKDKNGQGKAGRQNDKTAQKNNQGKGNANNARDKDDRSKERDKDLKEVSNGQGNQKEDKTNKGNAYGRNKGDQSGREFGQNRAAEARMAGKQKRAALGTTADEGDKKVKEAKEKIEGARTKLEKDWKAKKISETEYAERKVTIERAEAAVQDLEEKVNNAREMVSAAE